MKHSKESKFQTEIKNLTIDMRARCRDGETLLIAVSSVSVVAGIDSYPNDIISGSAVVVNGSTVQQKVIAGIAGVTYKLSVVVKTTLGNVYIDIIHLAILPSESVVYIDFRITDDGEFRITDDEGYRALDAA